MTAPERIWTDYTAANKVDLAYDSPPTSRYSECQDEYISVTALSKAPEVQALIAEAVAKERGRCATVAEQTGTCLLPNGQFLSERIAANIRGARP